jgi:hypothetical protein
MLLNEVQQQAVKLRDVERQLAAMQAAFAKLQTEKEVVAER